MLHLPPFKSNIAQKPFLHTGAHIFNFIATGKDTNGAFSLTHVHIRKGFEPPAHTHTRETESFYILEGNMQFVVGEEIIDASAGDLIFLPKDIKHSWQAITDTAKVLIIIEPAGLEQFFMDFSQRVEDNNLPAPPQSPPPTEFMETFIKALSQEYGVLL
jgi:quercetin dioxygenase-like cupin family protein